MFIKVGVANLEIDLFITGCVILETFLHLNGTRRRMIEYLCLADQVKSFEIFGKRLKNIVVSRAYLCVEGGCKLAQIAELCSTYLFRGKITSGASSESVL